MKPQLSGPIGIRAGSPIDYPIGIQLGGIWVGSIPVVAYTVMVYGLLRSLNADHGDLALTLRSGILLLGIDFSNNASHAEQHASLR